MATPTLPDDATLLAVLRRREESALVALVERYQGPLVRLARLRVGDTATAEEVPGWGRCAASLASRGARR